MKFLIVLNIEGGDSNGYLYFLSSEVVKHEHRLIISITMHDVTTWNKYLLF